MNLQQLFRLHAYPFDTLFELVIDEEWQILWGLRVEVDEELKATRDHLLELLVLVEWLMQEMVEPIIQVQKILQASEHKLWHLRIGLFSRHDAWKQNSKLYSSAWDPLFPTQYANPWSWYHALDSKIPALLEICKVDDQATALESTQNTVL